MPCRFTIPAVGSMTLVLAQCSSAPPPVASNRAPAFAIGADVRLREALAALDAGDAETAWLRLWELSVEGDPAAQVNLARL